MEAFSPSATAVSEPAAVDPPQLPGDFAAGLRRRPAPDVVADFATGLRARPARGAPSGHFATGQSWHAHPYAGRGTFATRVVEKRRAER
jgi:hypothetical protein